MDMNPVSNYICGQTRIGQYFTENSRLPVVNRTHCDERVSGMASSRSHAFARRLEISIGMPHADADSALVGFGDDFHRRLQLGRNRHEADMSSGGLPEVVEN